MLIFLSHSTHSFAMNSSLSQELCSLFLCQSVFSLPISSISCDSFLLYYRSWFFFSLFFYDCALFSRRLSFASLGLKRTIHFLSLSVGLPLSTQSLPSVCTKEQSTKWARHHYMFNGIRLFVWPKKMEIRFTLSQSVTFKHTHIHVSSMPFSVSA